MCFHVRSLSLSHVLSLLCALPLSCVLSLSLSFTHVQCSLSLSHISPSLSLPGNVDGDILAGGPGLEQEELVEQSGQELDVHPCLHRQQ